MQGYTVQVGTCTIYYLYMHMPEIFCYVKGDHFPIINHREKFVRVFKLLFPISRSSKPLWHYPDIFRFSNVKTIFSAEKMAILGYYIIEYTNNFNNHHWFYLILCWKWCLPSTKWAITPETSEIYWRYVEISVLNWNI